VRNRTFNPLPVIQPAAAPRARNAQNRQRFQFKLTATGAVALARRLL